MTREEHKATAMLLGYEHINLRLGYYYRDRKDFPGWERIDIKTFEPVSLEERNERSMAYDKRSISEQGRMWYDD
jgi:hypothetical protein